MLARGPANSTAAAGRPTRRGAAPITEPTPWDPTAGDEPATSHGTDRLPQFALVVRWGTVAVAASAALVSLAAPQAVFGIALAAALAAAVTVVQRRAYRSHLSAELVVAAYLVAAGALVAITGGSTSPFLVLTLSPVVDAALLTGWRRGLAAAALAALVPAAADLVAAGRLSSATAIAALEWALVVGVVAGAAAFARQQATALAAARRTISSERESSAQRLATIEDANTLLTELHRMAQTLPATLDLDGLIARTLDQMQDLFPAKTVAILTREDEQLRVVGVRGAAVSLDPMPIADAPAPLQIGLERPLAAAQLTPGTGLDRGARSILYMPLENDGVSIGLLALEDDDADRFGSDDIELLAGLAGSVAISLENARLFGRLRTLATSEERARIARELHDRTAQQLAAIAFELDHLGRIARKRSKALDEAAATGTAPPAATIDVADDIDRLATEIRRTIEDLRDAIGNLRTDVTDARGLVDLIREHAPRTATKGGITLDLDLPDRPIRLPLPQERELWRIYQEAVGNAAKHSGATKLRVAFHVTPENADLVIEDDGVGFDPRKRKLGHFGLTGMAERAEAIGAGFGIEARPGGGTTVRTTVRRRP